jgi:hypothetical protein
VHETRDLLRISSPEKQVISWEQDDCAARSSCRPQMAGSSSQLILILSSNHDIYLRHYILGLLDSRVGAWAQPQDRDDHDRNNGWYQDNQHRDHDRDHRDRRRDRDDRDHQYRENGRWRNDRDRDGGYYGNERYPNGPYRSGGYGYYGNGRYGYYGNGYPGSQASEIGYREGLNDGRNDSRTGHSFRPQHDDNYKNADRGYSSSMGDKNAYKHAYRNGYEQGYRAGYGRYLKNARYICLDTSGNNGPALHQIRSGLPLPVAKAGSDDSAAEFSIVGYPPCPRVWRQGGADIHFLAHSRPQSDMCTRKAR